MCDANMSLIIELQIGDYMGRAATKPDKVNL